MLGGAFLILVQFLVSVRVKWSCFASGFELRGFLLLLNNKDNDLHLIFRCVYGHV